jgi:hypothetical protein
MSALVSSRRTSASEQPVMGCGGAAPEEMKK